MKPSHIFMIVAITALAFILLYTFNESGSQNEYIKKIEQERVEKDRFMRTSAESPFAGEPETFAGLNFFPPNEKYRVMATLTPVKEQAVRTLATSDGKEEQYLEYAYATFDLDNRKNRLLILEVMAMGPYRGTLFLAFGDNTSAHETYGAGRYLDVKKTPGSRTIELDFNLAYNPYCAYSDSFSCPFPPKENLLSIPIRAGEKVYK